MKKLLYVALAALMLISCDPNGPKIDSKDKKMLDKASKNVLSLIGKDRKEVKAALEKAGWEDASYMGEVPQRFQQKAKYDATTSAIFVYGDLEGFVEAMMEEDEDAIDEWLEQVIKDKKIFAELLVVFDGKKLIGGECHMFVGNEYENINNLYLNFSKNIYKSITDPNWEGALIEWDDYLAEKEPDIFTNKKRDKFEAEFAELDVPYVAEEADGENSNGDDVYYGLEWGLMRSELSKELAEDLCEGAFYFGVPE